MKSKKNRKRKIKEKESIKSDDKEYGVILKKEKKYRHRIYPQKGKIPEEDDSYKIV
ncbi:MAG: hypothetical protein ACFFAO_07750 [Candidatus Hermodarchaeota archaeon]